MKSIERDEIVQYFIQIREKIKGDSNTILPLLKEIEAKVSALEKQRESEKQDLIDYIDNYKSILINMPVEIEKVKKRSFWERMKR